MGITALTENNNVYLLHLTDDSLNRPTGQRISELVINTMTACKIEPRKINACISDNAGNCRVARKTFISSEDYKTILEYRCFAHVINLIGKAAAKEPQLKPIMDQAEGLVNFVNNRATLRDVLEAQQGYTRLIHDVSTRWYSTRKKILSLRSNKVYFFSVIAHRGETLFENYIGRVEDSSFWAKLDEIADAYEPLNSLIAYSGSSDANLSKAFEIFIRIGLHLSRDISKQFRRELFSSFLMHFSRLDLDLMLTCMANDQSCDMKLLTPMARERVEQKIMAIAQSMGLDRKAIFATLDEFKAYKTSGGRYSLPKNINSKSKFKDISKRLASLRPSSANTERLFSSLKHVQTDRKSRMSLETLESMMRIKIEDKNMANIKTAKTKLKKNETRGGEEDVSGSSDSDEEDNREDGDEVDVSLAHISDSREFKKFSEYILDVQEKSSSDSSQDENSQGLTAAQLHEEYLRSRSSTQSQ